MKTRKKSTGNKRFFSQGFGFALPGILGFFIFFMLPFCLSLIYAFMDKPKGGVFVGFSNFIALFRNRAYIQGLFNTIRFISISTPLNIAFSLGIALMINKISKYREWFSLMFLIPLVIPSGSTVFFWKTLFSYDGALNGLLHTLGLEKINWLDSALALPVMVMIFLWKNCGYNMVLFLSGLRNIPRDYYDAASIDAASRLQTFLHIMVPCLLPTTVLAFIMSIINSFKIFREIYLITGSYPHESIYTLQHFMNNMFTSLNYPRLTSATTILVLIIAFFTQFLLQTEQRLKV
jgi:multiple sugar transport system permease protein